MHVHVVGRTAMEPDVDRWQMEGFAQARAFGQPSQAAPMSAHGEWQGDDGSVAALQQPASQLVGAHSEQSLQGIDVSFADVRQVATFVTMPTPQEGQDRGDGGHVPLPEPYRCSPVWQEDSGALLAGLPGDSPQQGATVSSAALSEARSGAASEGFASTPSTRRREGSCSSCLHRSALRYAENWAVKWPAAIPACCLGFVGLVVAIGLAAYPITVDSNFDSFVDTDVNASTERDVFLHAFEERNGRRLQGNALYKNYDVHVIYEIPSNSGTSGVLNLLEGDVIEKMRSFEKELRSLPQWQALCQEVTEQWRRLCDPGISAVNFAVPGMEIPHGEIVPAAIDYDGSGSSVLPPDLFLAFLEEYALRGIVLPANFGTATADGSHPPVGQLRSSFRFQLFCCTSTDPTTVQNAFSDKADQKWNEFVSGALLEFFEEKSEASSGIRIHLDGSDFTAIIVRDTLIDGDSWFSLGALLTIMVFLLIHTRSPLLSFAGAVILFLSVLLAYVVFSIFAGSTKMSIAFFLTPFLVVGIGSDVIFVYVESWRKTELVHTSMAERAAKTYIDAGLPSLATTAVTALSFFANMTSALRSLREFGCIMGLCLFNVWLLVSIAFVPLCVLDDTRCSGWRLCYHPQALGRKRHTYLEAAVSRLASWRRYVLLVPSTLGAVMLIWVFFASEVDVNMTRLLPADHQHTLAEAAAVPFEAEAEAFPPLFTAPPGRAEVCSEGDFAGKDTCQLFWCEVHGHAWADRASQGEPCQCYRREEDDDVSTCNTSTTAAVSLRIVSASPVTQPQLQGIVGDYLVAHEGDGLAYASSISREEAIGAASSAPMMLQEWESGVVNIMPVMHVSATLQRESEDSVCGWKELCFCGTDFVCMSPGRGQDSWAPSPTPSALQLDGDSRRLQGTVAPTAPTPAAGVVPVHLRSSVDVVFGMIVKAETSLLGEYDMSEAWSFDFAHEARQPWAQRNLYALCSQIPKDMKVVDSKCWIDDFRQYVVDLEYRFPLPANMFDTLVLEWARVGVTGLASSMDYLYIRDDEIRASYMTFTIDVSRTCRTNDALAHMKLWDDYLEEFNHGASRFARGAWHTSSLWVRAEAQLALVRSARTMVGIVLVLDFIIVILCSQDLWLAFLILCASIGVLSGLAWVLTVPMGWVFGPVEVISAVVVVGYAITYLMYIAYAYRTADVGVPSASEDSSPEEGTTSRTSRLSHWSVQFEVARSDRVMAAIRQVGPALLSSAVSTAISAIFLLCCTLTIFHRLGGVVLTVTIMSTFVALVPFLAALMILAPVSPGCQRLPRLEDAVYAAEALQEAIAVAPKEASQLASRLAAMMPERPKRPPPPPPPPVPAAAPKSKAAEAPKTAMPLMGLGSPKAAGPPVASTPPKAFPAQHAPAEAGAAAAAPPPKAAPAKAGLFQKAWAAAPKALSGQKREPQAPASSSFAAAAQLGIRPLGDFQLNTEAVPERPQGLPEGSHLPPAPPPEQCQQPPTLAPFASEAQLPMSSEPPQPFVSVEIEPMPPQRTADGRSHGDEARWDSVPTPHDGGHDGLAPAAPGGTASGSPFGRAAPEGVGTASLTSADFDFEIGVETSLEPINARDANPGLWQDPSFTPRSPLGRSTLAAVSAPRLGSMSRPMS
eukprot:TRINITY_DN6688_c0_g1_i1.p1 TRINITY_DN6688_c0_g1~~TRINITY_DN6688_c0_g1_i1.p1  ORF type:complete len:1629 (+),score=342.88 TRINITY_DN6688_c0_g1_i1:11-4897(+)